MSNAMKASFESQCNNSLLAGIVFDDSISNNLKSSTDLAYTIRLSNTKRRVSDLLVESQVDPNPFCATV